MLAGRSGVASGGGSVALLDGDEAIGGDVAEFVARAVRPADDEAIRRGLRFLIDTQLDDGSWHVVTRAKAFQTYFESGFPHEKDQFISIAASSWATLALLMTLPDAPLESPR